MFIIIIRSEDEGLTDDLLVFSSDVASVMLSQDVQ